METFFAHIQSLKSTFVIKQPDNVIAVNDVLSESYHQSNVNNWSTKTPALPFSWSLSLGLFIS